MVKSSDYMLMATIWAATGSANGAVWQVHLGAFVIFSLLSIFAIKDKP